MIGFSIENRLENEWCFELKYLEGGAENEWYFELKYLEGGQRIVQSKVNAVFRVYLEVYNI